MADITNASLGNGVLYVEKYDPTTQTYGQRESFGTITNLSYTITADKVELPNAMGKIGTVEDEVTIKENLSLTLDTLNISTKNRALALMGLIIPQAQAQATGVSTVVATPAIGQVIDLGVRNATIVSVTQTATPFTAYTFDAEFGVFELVGIGDGTAITITYDVPATSVDSISSFSDRDARYKLIHISNQQVGARARTTFPLVGLTPTGEMSLNAEATAFKKISFTGKAFSTAGQPLVIVD